MGALYKTKCFENHGGLGNLHDWCTWFNINEASVRCHFLFFCSSVFCKGKITQIYLENNKFIFVLSQY